MTGDNPEYAVPLQNLRRVVLLGKANCDGPTLYQLSGKGIPVDWLTIMGLPHAQLLPLDRHCDAALYAQTEFCHGAHALPIARRLILAKVNNCREILRRRTADHTGWLPRLKGIDNADNLESLRGHEGEAARFYFSHWSGLTGDLPWHGRHARPAPDPVNAMLNLGYTLLRNRLASAIRHAGLNPRLGIFHIGRGGHTALASDLMEPLRAVVDNCVLTLSAKRQFKQEDFIIKGKACICAPEGAFSSLLTEYEKMFERKHTFYYSNAEPQKRTLNDIMDDLAESFALCCHDRHGLAIPELAPCPPI